jgi:hypothetical protein
LGYRFRI